MHTCNSGEKSYGEKCPGEKVRQKSTSGKSYLHLSVRKVREKSPSGKSYLHLSGRKVRKKSPSGKSYLHLSGRKVREKSPSGKSPGVKFRIPDYTVQCPCRITPLLPIAFKQITLNFITSFNLV